jgi:hypothetical protein
MDIGHPFAVGMTLRMTDIMTELWRFTADFTLHFVPLDR